MAGLAYKNTYIKFVIFLLALLGVALIHSPSAFADNAEGPFISEPMRNQLVDYQQLTYTLACMPTTTVENSEFALPGSPPMESVGTNDMVFANNDELANRKYLDQGILANAVGRGTMFDHEILQCDTGADYGFVWPFANFGKGNLVDFYCTLPGVYNNQTGGRGKTIAGGTNKEACVAGAKLPKGKSFYVAKSGTNLRAQAKAEFASTKRGKIASQVLTPAKKYLQYWMTFQEACGASLTIKYPETGDPAADDGSLYRIPVVNQNGDVVDFVANTGGASTDGRTVVLDATHPYPGDTTCGQLAIGMRQFAPKYSAYLKGPGKSDPGATDGTGIPEIDPSDIITSDGTSCAIDGIGWIICPVMNFLAEMNEKAFDFLQSLLSIRPSLVQDKGTVEAWSKFRDLANVAFVIAFLVIIYSQITSVGVSNYGIKKLLPKIAIAALMVNLSLFFCQILVDVSNIAGAGLYSFIAGLVEPLKGTAGDSSWTTIMTGVLAAGVGVLLVVLVVTAPTVLLALGLILLILVARQAFILILVIISPLAFVAYLLPNTESLFKKWWKALSATLLVYPIIAVVFGASTLASNILMGIASSKGNISGSDDSQMLAIVALAVMAVPLFAVPVILKSAMSGAGKIGTTLAGLQDRANRRASGDAKDRAGKEFKDFGNRFTNRALGSTSRRGAAARFISGVGRRTKREDRYKQNQTLRDASQEDFLNQGINLQDPTNTQGLSKTAQRRVEAGAAKKTADTGNQIINNMGATSSMNANGALHKAAAYSSKATHHQEETLKNQGETRYYDNPTNAGHIAEGITAQENRQSSETNALNRAKTGIAPVNVAARQAIADNKASKGEEKMVDQGLELDFQKSDVGSSQAQGLKDVEGELEIVHGEQKNVFDSSLTGQAQSQQKKVIQGEGKLIEGDSQLVYEESPEGKNIERANLAVQSQVDTAKTATKAEFTGSRTGKALNIDSAVAQATLGAADAANKAQVEELKAGAEAAGVVDTSLEQAAIDLSAADIATRAQTQRSASAQNVANTEYAGKVKASQGVAGGLAEVSGGIDEYGASRAVAVASQVWDKQLVEAIGAQKTLFESTRGDKLEAEYKTGFVDGDPTKGRSSPERMAAVAGTIAGRGYMGGKLELLKATGPALKQAKDNAKARGLTTEEEINNDPAVQAIIYSQKQITGDMREWPFGASDTMRDLLGLGQWEGDFDAGFQTRIGTKLTGDKLGTLKAEEMADLESIFSTLTTEQKASLDAAVQEAKTNEAVRKNIKPEIWNSLERMGYSRPSVT